MMAAAGEIQATARSACRRVLMLSPHFPPDSSAASHRVRLLAPYLAECGWEPVVLTLRPEAYDGGVDPALLALVPPSLAVVRAPAWPARWTRAVGIGDAGLRGLPGLRRTARRTMRELAFDALFITIYPTYPALLGPALKRRFHVPFVLDYQDPWVGSWGLTVGGAPDGTPDLKSRASRRLATLLEPVAVRAADAITAVSTGTYESVLARIHADPPPVVAELPLGWDAADLDAAGDARTTWFDPADGAVHLSYVGTLLPKGIDVLRSLLTAVRALRDRTPSLYARVKLHFFGTSNQFDSAAPDRVMPIARETGVADAVTEHPPRVPYLEALRILRGSSAILLLGSSEPHYTASKIYPALLARRPLLAAFHRASNAAAVLDAFGRPPSVRLVTFDGDRPAPEALRLHLADIADGARYDDRMVDWRAVEPFSARALAGRLAGVLDEVAR